MEDTRIKIKNTTEYSKPHQNDVISNIFTAETGVVRRKNEKNAHRKYTVEDMHFDRNRIVQDD